MLLNIFYIARKLYLDKELLIRSVIPGLVCWNSDQYNLFGFW